jgi:DNA-binding Lrp family transcriptional regulator
MDKKDREILRILNKNSRTPDSGIAKKLRVSKQTVSYRIKRMQQKGIIRNFYTEFDVSRLGFNSYYVFIELEKITNSIEKEIIKKLSEEENIGWIISAIGKSSIILLVYARTMMDFESEFLEIKHICSGYLRESSLAILTESQKLSYRFLGSGFEVVQKEKQKEVELDETDIKIMKTISQNARQKLVEIARKTGLSVDTVGYRLKKLKNIIKGFKTKLDTNKIGLQWHLLLVRTLSIDGKTRKRFTSYLGSLKEVYYITSTVGSYDLLIDLHVKNSEEIMKFILKLRDLFPNVIKNYESLLVSQEHKLSYLPSLG